jgi:DNA-binding CsgD family transcriptional regulator
MHTDWQALLEERMTHLGLSPRKREVMWHMIAGMSTEEIAARLFIEQKTVQGHISQSCDRLGIIVHGDKPRRIHILLYLLGVDLGELRRQLRERAT